MESNPHPLPVAPIKEENPDVFNALAFGAAVSFVSSIIPYVALTIIAPTVLGAATAVWWRICRQKRSISLGQAALLGVGAGILGDICYTAIYDLLWIYFDYRHGAREEEAATLAFAEWLGGSGAREAAEAELIKSRAQEFSVGQLLLQSFMIIFVNGIFASTSGVITGYWNKRRSKAALSKAN